MVNKRLFDKRSDLFQTAFLVGNYVNVESPGAIADHRE